MHKILKFLSLTPYYLLKLTKFLVEISQFEFLVITEKNIFVYKLFLLLNISDFFFFFFFVNLQAPWKKLPLLSSNPFHIVEVLSSCPFLKLWYEVQLPPLPPPPSRHTERGLYTMIIL